MLPSIIRVCYNLEEFVTHTANQSTGQVSQSVSQSVVRQSVSQSVNSQSVTGLLMFCQPHMVISGGTDTVLSQRALKTFLVSKTTQVAPTSTA